MKIKEVLLDICQYESRQNEVNGMLFKTTLSTIKSLPYDKSSILRAINMIDTRVTRTKINENNNGIHI